LQWDNEPYMNIDSLVEFAISSLMNALVQKKCTPEEKDEIIDNMKRNLRIIRPPLNSQNLSLNTTRLPTPLTHPQPANQKSRTPNPTPNRVEATSINPYKKMFYIDNFLLEAGAENISHENHDKVVYYLRDTYKELYNIKINEPSQLGYSITVCRFLMTHPVIKDIRSNQFNSLYLNPVGQNIISSPLFKNLPLNDQAAFISSCLQWAADQPHMNIDRLVERALSSLKNILIQNECTPEEKDKLINNIKISLQIIRTVLSSQIDIQDSLTKAAVALINSANNGPTNGSGSLLKDIQTLETCIRKDIPEIWERNTKLEEVESLMVKFQGEDSTIKYFNNCPNINAITKLKTMEETINRCLSPLFAPRFESFKNFISNFHPDNQVTLDTLKQGNNQQLEAIIKYLTSIIDKPIGNTEELRKCCEHAKSIAASTKTLYPSHYASSEVPESLVKKVLDLCDTLQRMLDSIYL
nr:hypothetical protein [Burkholderiales bacterium]